MTYRHWTIAIAVSAIVADVAMGAVDVSAQLKAKLLAVGAKANERHYAFV